MPNLKHGHAARLATKQQNSELTMIISDLEFYRIRIDCDQPAAPISSLVVRLATHAGSEGWGEAHLDWRTLDLNPRRDALLPTLAGRSVFDVEELSDLEPLSPNPLRCAIEMACWDLIGQITGQPICRLLGGEYRRRIPVIVPIEGQSIEHCRTIARELAGLGCNWQLLTLQGDLEHDVQLITAVRENVGNRVELRLDGHHRYEFDAALELCTRIEELGVAVFIDPIASDIKQDAVHGTPGTPDTTRQSNESARNRGAIESLQRQVTVPLGVCRSITGPADVLQCVARRPSPQITIDPETVGGLLQAKKCAIIAQAAGQRLSIGRRPSLGIGTAAMLQIAASSPAISTGNLSAHHWLDDDILVDPLEIIDGLLTTPQGPGLGVQIDRAKIERYAQPV